MRFSLINHKNETLHNIHPQNRRGEGVKLDVIYEVYICFICYWIGEYQLYVSICVFEIQGAENANNLFTT